MLVFTYFDILKALRGADMFITFEGGEGSGKSTIIKKIKALFEAGENEQKYSLVNQTTGEIVPLIFTREPGGLNIALAEEIRDVCLHPKHTTMQSETEALLFAASRSEHVKQLIEPNREKALIICDRYIDSSYVYQGVARGLGIEYIKQINKSILNCLPDLTFIFIINHENGLNRVSARNKINRLDKESRAFHNKIDETYRELKQIFPERKYIEINAEAAVDTVFRQVFDNLTKELANKNIKIVQNA